MKVIILAAGVGSRLGLNTPKALVKLDDNISILDSQLSAFGKYFDQADILVVIGFKKELIMEQYPNLKLINNEKYETTNTSKSLLRGLEMIDINEDAIYINGDVVFDPSINELILNNRDRNLICVNNARVSEEEVKYSLGKDNTINYLSKTVNDPLGEAVGINYLNHRYINEFKKCLQSCSDNDYHEKAVELAIEKGIKFYPANIGKRLCIEVDFEQDLKNAAEIWKTLSDE